MTSPNKVAIITGAASGIGRALAVHYARQGVVSVIGTFPAIRTTRRRHSAWSRKPAAKR